MSRGCSGIPRLCSTSGYSTSALAVDETLCRPESWLLAHKMARLLSRHIRVELPLTGLQERYTFCDHMFEQCWIQFDNSVVYIVLIKTPPPHIFVPATASPSSIQSSYSWNKPLRREACQPYLENEDSASRFFEPMHHIYSAPSR